MTKECNICKAVKSSVEFFVRSDNGRPGPYCKPCHAIRATVRYRANPEHGRLQAKRWRQDNPERVSEIHRNSNIRAYGIEPEDYEALLLAQGGVCAICEKICKTGKRLSIDHDHVSGQVRGLLCSSCNRGIGNLHDDVDLLVRAANYLCAAAQMTERSKV